MKIRGNTVGFPNPQPDWNQTDDTQADYIKNKPESLIPKTTAIDFSGLEGGTWTETLEDGTVVTHQNTYDADGRPTAIDGTTITWG